MLKSPAAAVTTRTTNMTQVISEYQIKLRRQSRSSTFPFFFSLFLLSNHTIYQIYKLITHHQIITRHRNVDLCKRPNSPRVTLLLCGDTG